MRKALGLFFATSLLVSVATIAASPAGAAARCRRSARPSPAPDIDAAVAEARRLDEGELDGEADHGGDRCTVRGITKGPSSATTKIKRQNCTTTVQSSSEGAKSKGKIIWNNQKTSTTANTLTLKSKVGVSSTTFQLVTKFTAGIESGHTTTSTISMTLNKKACTKPVVECEGPRHQVVNEVIATDTRAEARRGLTFGWGPSLIGRARAASRPCSNCVSSRWPSAASRRTRC